MNYVDVGLKLDVEPTIYLNNEVGIRISLEVSNLVDTVTTKGGMTAYRIGTRSASTMLQLRDGENQVLAGLIKNEDRASSTKLPGVGDLPVLGRLCGSQQDTRNKTEVVLSITPHLIRNLQAPAGIELRVQRGHRGELPAPTRHGERRGVLAVYSLATAKPLKQANFDARFSGSRTRNTSRTGSSWPPGRRWLRGSCRGRGWDGCPARRRCSNRRARARRRRRRRCFPAGARRRPTRRGRCHRPTRPCRSWMRRHRPGRPKAATRATRRRRSASWRRPPRRTAARTARYLARRMNWRGRKPSASSTPK